MSDTESFENVMDTLLNGFTHDVRTDELSGSYKMIAARLDRLQAAHDREIRDTAQQQYDRGFNDGRHSMDAEHRAVAMRLRALPLDGGSHENLSQIARAVYHSDFGWTKGACAALRDELVRLLGGVSDEVVHVGRHSGVLDCACDAVRGDVDGEHVLGVSCHHSGSHVADGMVSVDVIGDSDDTCDSQRRGACADSDGGDSGEQEVSDGRTGAIGVTEPVGCNDERGDDCDGRDSGESEVGDGRAGDSYTRSRPLRSTGRDDVCICRDSGEHSGEQVEVSDERLADDCAADSRGGDGGSGVHMAGLVTYDVLGNERHKAVCELRKLRTGYDGGESGLWEWLEELHDALGSPKLCSLGIIRQRLIHLLGGDQPSGIDVLREMDADGTSPNDNEICSNDGPTSSITDELREWMSTVLTSDDYAWAIADRIDEQFDRICQQHETVLQSTIDETVGECDNLLDLLRDARDEYKTLDQMSAETSANFHAMRDRAWSAEAERDELQDKLDRANGENKGLRLSIDEQKESIAQRKKTIGKLARDNKKVWKTVHELQAKVDEYDRTYVELPKDANGNVIFTGHSVRKAGSDRQTTMTAYSLTLTFKGWSVYASGDSYAVEREPSFFEVCEPKPDTAESIVRDLSMGAVTESEAIERIEALNG